MGPFFHLQNKQRLLTSKQTTGRNNRRSSLEQCRDPDQSLRGIMLQAVPLAGRHLPIVVGSAPDALEEDTSSSNECVTPTAADVWRELFELEGPSSDEVGELNELRSRTLRVERVELDSDGRVRLGHAEIVELYARSSQHNGKGKSKNTCNRRTRPGGGDDCGKQQNKAETERFAATVVANTNQTLLEAEKAPELPETQEQLADEGQRYHALPLGHHPERSMEAATWSPEHRAFLRKTIICRRAMMISYTYCVVSVFGLGVAGRLFDPGGGSSTPKMLLVEVYSVWDSAVHKMTFTLAQVASVLRGHELMWRAGRKRDLVDRLVRQLYFEYHILIPGRLLQRGQEAREESASSTVAAQPGLVLEHVEDPPEHLHLPTVGELIEHHSNPAASKVSTCPQLRQVLKVAYVIPELPVTVSAEFPRSHLHHVTLHLHQLGTPRAWRYEASTRCGAAATATGGRGCQTC